MVFLHLICLTCSWDFDFLFFRKINISILFKCLFTHSRFLWNDIEHISTHEFGNLIRRCTFSRIRRCISACIEGNPNIPIFLIKPVAKKWDLLLIIETKRVGVVCCNIGLHEFFLIVLLVTFSQCYCFLFYRLPFIGNIINIGFDIGII